ncbi:MAG: pyridoxamine kinase [Clostridia bacterium]|nr:pyridoxamine kinase [Clostridia bacterium]
MKRIVTLQDISCVGKCALTVALPIISACGIEACPIPTTLLSNHTAFDSFESFDLTDNSVKIIEQFIKHDFTFDGIYTGYLGSVDQVNVASNFIDRFRRSNSPVLVDPVMGDNGRLYSGIGADLPEKIKELCLKADIIVPNVTEASFLLGKDGSLEYSSLEDVKTVLMKLTDAYCPVCVLTGVELSGKSGAVAFNARTNEFYCCLKQKIDRVFHGTGDVFASVLFSCIVNEKPLEKALETAVNFTFEAMMASVNNPDSVWYGVDFETVLPILRD